VSLAFLLATAIVLVLDLDRPERFYYILIRPNRRSWMAWGAYFLAVQGAITALWIAAGWFDASAIMTALAWPAIASSVLTTSYTGFLFAQGLARDLWQGPHAAVDLLAQASAEGAAALIVTAIALGGDASLHTVACILAGAVAAHLLFIIFDNLLAPSPTRHHDLAVSAIRSGPFARLFWSVAFAAGGVLPLVVMIAVPAWTRAELATCAALALAGSFAWEYIWVEAGQSVPLS
jgi:formate-dependent nitrite reductase membrane component NrfD